MYGYEEEGDEARSPIRAVVGIGVVVVLAALAWLVVRPALDDDESTGVIPIDSSPSPTSTAVERLAATTADGGGPITDDPAASSSVVATTPDTAISAVTAASTSPPSTDPPGAATTVVSAAIPSTSAPETDQSTSVPDTTEITASYDTLPDGSPVPVVATFDVETITLEGAVPSQAAADRLAALAIANSKTPATVDSRLTINPDIPLGLGVRVIELNSVRFPEGSSEVLFLHAIELDRVARVMDLLPNVTVLVVGHADQRGNAAENFALSEERARSVVNYLVGAGVKGERLSSRAVGESDLLSVDNDATSLALNRRTEFIFYGLLIE